MLTGSRLTACITVFACALLLCCAGCEDPCTGAANLVQQAAELRGDRELQMQTYQRAIKKCPKIREDLILGAQSSIMSNNLEDAEYLMRAVLESDKNDPNAHLLMGQIFERKGGQSNLRRAMQSYEQAKQLKNADGNLSYMMAEASLRLGDKEKAMALFQEAAQRGIDPARISFRLGTLALEAGDFASAKQHLMEARQLNPTIGAIPFQLGEIFFKEEKYHEAQKAYVEALELDPTLVPAYEALAKIAVMQGDIYGAIEKYQTVLRSRPPTIDLLSALAWALYLAGQHQDAHTIAVRALNMGGGTGSEQLLDTFGHVLVALGNREEAARVFRELIRRRPDDPWTNYGQGMTLKLFGNEEEARTHLTRAHQLNAGKDRYLNTKLESEGFPAVTAPASGTTP